MAGGEFGGKPALQRGIDQRRKAFAAHLFDAGFPGGGAADFLRGGAHHQPAQALRCLQAQPLPGEPADRQAAEIALRDLQGVPQCQHVLTQVGDAVRAGRRLRIPVAAAVVAQDAVVRSEGFELHVPHVQIGAQRIAEGQPGASFGAVQAVMQAMRGQLEISHRSTVNGKKIQPARGRSRPRTYRAN